MALCRFLLADRPAPEALRPLAIQLLFGDPLSSLSVGAAGRVMTDCDPVAFSLFNTAPGQAAARACPACWIDQQQAAKLTPSK
jgi:hypothetical protein